MTPIEVISDQSPYKSISRAACILSCLNEGKNTLTEIAQGCELSKSTAIRLLQAMEKSNLVVRDPIHRKYFPGSLINRLLANPKTTHLNLITLSLGEMNRLSKMCGETIVLGILVGIQSVRLHMIPSIYNIRAYDDESSDVSGLNLHGAAIKASLSQLEPIELSKVVDIVLSEGATNNSDINKALFLEQINEIRKHGYAISRGEKIAGALAISVPIKGYHLPASLSIVGVESRFETKLSELLPEIIASAQRISGNLANLT